MKESVVKNGGERAMWREERGAGRKERGRGRGRGRERDRDRLGSASF